MLTALLVHLNEVAARFAAERFVAGPRGLTKVRGEWAVAERAAGRGDRERANTGSCAMAKGELTKKQVSDVDRLRAERETLLARYDSGAMPESVAAHARSLETDIAWAVHEAAQRGAAG